MVKRSRIVAFFLVLILFAGLLGGTTNKVMNKINLGLDLQGGFEVLYQVKAANKGQKIDKAVLKNTVNALERRVNALGVSEPNIQIEGNDRIRVQLAGVKDQNQARDVLSTQANLTFRDVDDKEYLNGSDIVAGSAKQSFTSTGAPDVVLKLKDQKKFKNVTQAILNKAPNNQLVIWLDYNKKTDSFKKEATKKNPGFLSAPNVSQVLNTDTVQIEGNFKLEEAKNLASILDAGALPVKLKEIYSTSVGAQFGQEALKHTVEAGLIGLLFIYVFMIIFYRIPGFVASVALTVYVFLTLLVFSLLHAVLTLPGIAALILGVGMAVDANIITYEHIKEEIRLGRPIATASKTGNKRSFITIFDAQITTLLAAAVLFAFGVSSVKGFATSLIISIILSFVTAVFGSRYLLHLLVSSGLFKSKPWWFGVKKSSIQQINTKGTPQVKTAFDRVDFVKRKNIWFSISGILIIAGIIIMLIFKLNLSIDFMSGSRVEVNAKQPITSQMMATDLKTQGYTADDIVVSGQDNKRAVMRLKGSLSKAETIKLNKYFSDKYGQVNISSVSPTVGKELAKNSFYALIFAAIGIIIYVSIRFEWRMGVATIVALLHDVFFIVAIFSISRLEVDPTFIAAILTIVGYSINDTIVTFDRIRDLTKAKRYLRTDADIAEVVNQGIRQTLTRSINTVLTVVFATIALLILGGEPIRNFSIAMLIGLIIGCYSSIYIAAQLWYILKKRQLKKNGPIKTFKEKRTVSDEPQV